MTLREAKKRVEKIEEMSQDGEEAHSLEDQLYDDFIEFVSKNDKCPIGIKKIAREILKTQDIDFPRWYA